MVPIMAEKIKGSFVFEAKIPASFAGGEKVIEAYERKEVIPELTVSKAAWGGSSYTLMTVEGEEVARINMIRNDDGSEIQDLESLVARMTPESYKVVIDTIEGRTMTGHIDHMVDESTVVDGRSDEEIGSDIQQLISEKVSAGIVTQEDAEERIRYMKDHGADEALIFMVIKAWIPHEKAVRKPDCLYVDKFLEQAHANHEDGVIVQILKMTTLGYSIIVSSARGLGKLVLTQTVAWLRGQPVYSAILSRDTSAEIAEGKAMTDNTASDWLMSEEARKVSYDALCGDLKSKATMELMSARAASVSIVIDKSEFYKCMKDRGVMAVDEINCGDPNLVERIFNPLLDGHKKMYFPGLGELTAERPFTVIATMNEGYEGTNEQNMATMSRFKHIRLQYPKTLRDIIEASAKAELKNLGYPDVKIRTELLNQAEKFYNKIFKASIGAEPLISDTALNVRGFASALVTCTVFEGSSLAQYLRDGVLNACPAEELDVLEGILQDTVSI